MSRYNNRPSRDSLTATDLSKLGTCEKRMVLDYQYGSGKDSKRVKSRKAEGKDVHNRSLQAAIRHHGEHSPPTTPATDRRCFIATAVYGNEAWQTEVLRQWRDRKLLRNAAGRVLVRVYYAVSPAIARFLDKHARSARLTRRALDVIVRRTAR